MATHAPARDGRQARWAKHNEERRQQILEAAVAVLEGAEPGADYHVQQIAEQAGLNRTVVYRHFTDRADLDRAVQAMIVDDLAAQLLPAVSLDGTIREIISRIVSTYVDWVVAHPALHRFADQDSGGAFQLGLARIAAGVVALLEGAIEILGVELDARERASIDPLAHGLVGAVVGAVRRWVTRQPREPDTASMVDLLAESVWNLLDGHGRRLGLQVDPELTLTELIAGSEADS